MLPGGYSHIRASRDVTFDGSGFIFDSGHQRNACFVELCDLVLFSW